MAITLSAGVVLPVTALILGAVMALQWTGWRALVGRTLSSAERFEKMIAQHRDVLRGVGRRQRPQAWARTQIALGGMLVDLGQETSDKVPVEGAIEAFRSALSVLSPDPDWVRNRPKGKILRALAVLTPRGRRTYKWADAQHRLGFALGYLASTTDQLWLFDESIDAFRAALTVFAREGDPANWANSQAALAVTLSSLAAKGRPGVGDEAVAIYQALLQSQSEDDTSPQATEVLRRYGSALVARSEFGDGPDALGEAVAVLRRIVGQEPSEQLQDIWAFSQRQLGEALRRLGQQTGDPVALEEALAIQRGEFQGLDAQSLPAERAGLVDEIGADLSELGRLREDPTLLREAVSCFQDALENLSAEDQPLNWAEVQDNLASALVLLSRYEDDGDTLSDADAAVHHALSFRTRERSPLLWAISTDTLGAVLRARALSDRRKELATESIEAHRAAIAVFDHMDARFRLRIAQKHLAEAEATLAQFA